MFRVTRAALLERLRHIVLDDAPVLKVLRIISGYRAEKRQIGNNTEIMRHLYLTWPLYLSSHPKKIACDGGAALQGEGCLKTWIVGRIVGSVLCPLGRSPSCSTLIVLSLCQSQRGHDRCCVGNGLVALLQFGMSRRRQIWLCCCNIYLGQFEERFIEETSREYPMYAFVSFPWKNLVPRFIS